METSMKKLDTLKAVPFKDYYKKRLEFIKWARSERYTLKEIGGWLGISKEAVFKIIKVDSLKK